MRVVQASARLQWACRAALLASNAALSLCRPLPGESSTRPGDRLESFADRISQVPEEEVPIRSVTVASDGSCLVAGNNKVSLPVFVLGNRSHRCLDRATCTSGASNQAATRVPTRCQAAVVERQARHQTGHQVLRQLRQHRQQAPVTLRTCSP